VSTPCDRLMFHWDGNHVRTEEEGVAEVLPGWGYFAGEAGTCVVPTL
jgi:hypothetical protein